MDGQDGSDTLIGGGGGDAMIDTGATGTDTVTYFESTVGVRVTVDDGAANDGANGGAEGDSVGKGFERIQGSGFDDIIEGGPAAETINGSAGNDQLDGKGGADRLEGNEGEDTLRARDGIADPLLDCDSASSRTQGTQDVALIDPEGVDPDPLRCESVQRAAGGSGPTPGLPAATAIPTISPRTLRAGVTATCKPGTWTGSPSFSYGWFTVADGSKPARQLANGPTYKFTAADGGRLVFCVELATNAAGSVPARSVVTAVTDTGASRLCATGSRRCAPADPRRPRRTGRLRQCRRAGEGRGSRIASEGREGEARQGVRDDPEGRGDVCEVIVLVWWGAAADLGGASTMPRRTSSCRRSRRRRRKG